MSLEKKLEAILFYTGEPESKEKLVKILETNHEELEKAITNLGNSLENHGVRLLRVNDQIELVSAPETSEVLNKVKKEELTRDLGKASAETLAIVLYRGPVSRTNIDYIRGVNSTFILRNLQIRGLIERVQDKENSRLYVYQPTSELLKHLGVTSVTELPDYESMYAGLAAFESGRHSEEGIDKDAI